MEQQQPNPFPIFTRFFKQFGREIVYIPRLQSQHTERGFAGNVLVQLDRFDVLDGQLEQIVGKIEATLMGNSNWIDYFYDIIVTYDGKLPTKEGLTKVNRRIVYKAKAKSLLAEPEKRTVSQPRFYKHKIPDDVFAYAVSPEHKIETRKN